MPVLLHDSTLKRLWDHDRPLSALSYDEVRGLTAGGVPTLEQALEVLAERRVMVDLPGADVRTVRTVIGVIRDGDAGERAYYCAGAETMLEVRRADPAAEIALTWTTLAPPRPGVLEAIRPTWLNYRFPLVSRELTAHVHRQGLLVSAWTPDTKSAMRRLLGLGVDSVTTNRIDVLCGLRRD